MFININEARLKKYYRYKCGIKADVIIEYIVRDR